MKLPIEVSQKLKLPREVDQDWTALDKKIVKAIDEAYQPFTKGGV